MSEEGVLTTEKILSMDEAAGGHLREWQLGKLPKKTKREIAIAQILQLLPYNEEGALTAKRIVQVWGDFDISRSYVANILTELASRNLIKRKKMARKDKERSQYVFWRGEEKLVPNYKQSEISVDTIKAVLSNNTEWLSSRDILMELGYEQASHTSTLIREVSAILRKHREIDRRYVGKLSDKKALLYHFSPVQGGKVRVAPEEKRGAISKGEEIKDTNPIPVVPLEAKNDTISQQNEELKREISELEKRIRVLTEQEQLKREKTLLTEQIELRKKRESLEKQVVTIEQTMRKAEVENTEVMRGILG